ncbi:MAG: hypothetical protein LBQ18_05275 [Campylobacteraceae bacterium]|jgi:hypothetical protein|nr:hypothetical protein [Campylobacteraceae bacterium]
MKKATPLILLFAVLAQMVFAENNQTLIVYGNRTISKCEVTIGHDFHESLGYGMSPSDR